MLNGLVPDIATAWTTYIGDVKAIRWNAIIRAFVIIWTIVAIVAIGHITFDVRVCEGTYRVVPSIS